MTSTRAKRILVFESDKLLNAGVLSFLSTQAHLEVIGMEVEDKQSILESIQQLKPDVIILDQSNQAARLPVLLKFLDNYPNLKTIMVNLSGNTIQVYDKQQILLSQISDFLAVL